MFTDCLQPPSLNSHRKRQTAPPSEKISLTYMHEKAVLGTMFQTVFTPCLQIPLTYKDKKFAYFTPRGGGFTIYLQNSIVLPLIKTKIQQNPPLLKTFLTYIHEIAVLNTHFQKCL